MSPAGFDPWPTLANPQQIRRSADGLQSITGDLLGHGAAVGTVLNRVATSFSEIIAPAVAAQIGSNAALLESAVEGTVYGCAVGSAWADDVEAFIAARAALIAEWEAVEGGDFGVPPIIGLANADPEMAASLVYRRGTAIGNLRELARQDYERRGCELWENFQAQVEHTGRMFRDGPTPANLAFLAPYLGWAATTLWPEAATPTPVEGMADGNAAASTVIDGLVGTANPQSVVDALSAVALINQRASYGQELTPEEVAFLEAFYAGMGIRITELPRYLAQTSFEYTTSAPSTRDTQPGGNSPDGPLIVTPHSVGALDTVVVTALSAASANGLLVLSRPTARTDDDGHDGYERLPAWVRDALDPTVLGAPGEFADLVEIGDLLAYSTVPAGTGLSRELALGVEWMIEHAADSEDHIYPEVAQGLRDQIAASAPSLLDVVSRNDEVCLDLLTGSGMPEGFSPAEYFTSVYAFGWAIDDGAAAAGLTDFIPQWAASGNPVDGARAQEAMFNLVQIVTSDPGFEVLMDGVGASGIPAESAVGQVNPLITQGFAAAMASYLDQFAGPQTDGGQPTGLGDLPFEARVRFMTMIGTDPDSAAALAGAAYAYEQQELLEYAASGDATTSGGAVGRIRGLVDAGLIRAEMDAGADAADAEAAAESARQTGRDIVQGILGSIPVPGASSLVDTVAAIIDSQRADDGGPGQQDIPGSDATPVRTEDQRRFDTVASVMTALVSSGQISEAALPPYLIHQDGTIGEPPPFVGPAPAGQQGLSVEQLTDQLLAAAAAQGYDLVAILDRIESAYGDPDLLDERDG